jgi:hypothetical protein
VDKLTGNKVTLTLAMAADIVLLFVGLPGAIMTFAQTSSSPAISTSINTTNAANTTTAGSSNDTRIPAMQNLCQPAQSNGLRQSSSSTNEISNNTANAGGGAASSSNRTMQGRPNPNNTTSNTSNNYTTTPRGQNVSAISRSIGQARTDLVEACNAVNNGDSSSTLVHLNLVARALDNIEGNLSSTIATGRGGVTTNVPPTGGTSASSVEGATAGEQSGS